MAVHLETENRAFHVQDIVLLTRRVIHRAVLVHLARAGIKDHVLHMGHLGLVAVAVAGIGAAMADQVAVEIAVAVAADSRNILMYLSS